MNLDIKRFKSSPDPVDPEHEKAWLDWIGDTTVPVPPTNFAVPGHSQSASPLIRQDDSERLQAVAPPPNGPTEQAPPPVVSIQIQLPSLSLKWLRASYKYVAMGVAAVHNRIKQFPKRAYIRLGIGLITIALLSVSAAVYNGIRIGEQQKQAIAAKALTDEAVAANAKPTFKPLAPQSSATAATSGTPQVAYDSARNTYSFTDVLKQKPIVVSQQPIPSKFSDANTAVSKIAIAMGAKESVDTAIGTAYVLTDTKANAQTIVFTKNNLLVFIQSPFTHPNEDWKHYIEALNTQ